MILTNVARRKPPKKKVISTKAVPKDGPHSSKFRSKNKVRARKSSKSRVVDLPFGKRNYQLVAVGAILVLIGMLLMTGGAMPSPDVWDDSRIYSFRRITLAPIVIVAGLVVEIFAIFRN